MFKKIINKIAGYFYFRTLDFKENVSTHTDVKQANLDLKGLENMLRSMEVLMGNNLPQGQKVIVIEKNTFKDFPLKLDITMSEEPNVPPSEVRKDGLSKETVDKLRKFFEDGRNIRV